MSGESLKEIYRVSLLKARKTKTKEGQRRHAGRLCARKHPSAFLAPGLLLLFGMSLMCALAFAQNLPKLTVSLITLTPDGFQPKEIDRAPGSFILAVDNRSGMTDDAIVFSIGVLGGAKVAEVRLIKGRPGWRSLTNLLPGEYVLQVAGQPKWTCKITITAQ